MKRFGQVALVMTVLLALAAPSVDAQMLIKFGFKGGLNSSTVTGDDTDDYESRSSFMGGVFVTLPLKAGFSLQSELLYSGKGAKITDTTAVVPVELILKANYFEIPILLKYGFLGKGPAGLYFVAGPVFAFSASSKTRIEGSLVGIPVGASRDNYNEKSSDLGLAIGVGADFSLIGPRLNVEVRYTVGLYEMWNDVDVATLPDDLLDFTLYADETTGQADDMKNSVISITAGFMF